MSIRAVKADVFKSLTDMRVGWKLNGEGVGEGKHFGHCFQDPTLVCPAMAGSKFRTTLIQDDGQWLVMELCEPLDTLIDLGAEFHGFVGDRFIITIITSSERPPQAMGFRMLDEGEEPLQPAIGLDSDDAEPAAPLAPEDAEVVGIDVDEMQLQQDAQGMDIPQGQVVISPERGDHLVVTGVEIFKGTALATMREACSFHNLSTSGSRERCFKRLFENQKKLELQLVFGAAREAQVAQEHMPRPQHLAEPPSEDLQMKHNLTHLPFADWCPSCISHRSRPDRQERTGAVKDSSNPTVSFDFAYTKAVGPDGIARNTDTVIALVMVDSVTNYVGCVPVKSKAQTDLMVRKLTQFTQVLGHAEVTYLCDNEPAARQVQKLVVRARQALALPTKDKNPAAYSHGNSLCENSIQRIRDLAGTLMHRVQDRLSTELSTDNGLWSWAMRHAAWLLNRFAVVHGCTPFELVYGKVYQGRMTEFGEPAFSYTHTAHKGNPKWQRVIILGKTESQDTYVVFTGKGVMLSRSVRRLEKPPWLLHLLQCSYVVLQDWLWEQNNSHKTKCGSSSCKQQCSPWSSSSISLA